MRISKIPAARTLGEVAAEGRQLSHLRRGETLRARRDPRIGRAHVRIGRYHGNGRQRAEGGGAVFAP